MEIKQPILVSDCRTDNAPALQAFWVPPGTYSVKETISVPNMRGYAVVGSIFRAIYDELDGSHEPGSDGVGAATYRS